MSDRPAEIWSYVTGLADSNTAEPDSGTKPQIKVLHRGESETIIRLAFREGQEMTEHTAAHPIVVLGQVGHIDFTVDGETVPLTPGTAIRVDTRIPHALHARSDGTVTLIVVHSATGPAKS